MIHKIALQIFSFFLSLLQTLKVSLNKIKSAGPGQCLTTPPLIWDFITSKADIKQFYSMLHTSFYPVVFLLVCQKQCRHKVVYSMVGKQQWGLFWLHSLLSSQLWLLLSVACARRSKYSIYFFFNYVIWYLLPPPKKSKKAADTFNTDVNQCIFTSTAICHRVMLLLLPVLCSVLRFVRVVKPTLASFNTFSLTCGLRQVCFFSLTRVRYFGSLDSISLVLRAHWGNPENQLGSSESGATIVFMWACVMTEWCQVEKAGYFLHLCQLLMYEVRGRKTKWDRNRGKVGEKGPRGPSVFCLHVRLLN